jgi:hypothetical protein
VSGKSPNLRERRQTVRAAGSKCLRRTPKGVRAARKGFGGLLPGAENRTSPARVSDGRLKPNSEDSLYDCLLLGDGDINNRGEGGEGLNTPVCRPRGVHKTLKRGPSPSQDRACAKTDFSITTSRFKTLCTVLSTPHLQRLARRKPGFETGSPIAETAFERLRIRQSVPRRRGRARRSSGNRGRHIDT